jgi:predicted acetyltransferase
MAVELVSAKADGRKIVENLFHYYIYDMSVFMGWKINSTGSYDVNFSLLDEYWDSPDNHPYIIMYDDEIAGFSLLRRYPGSATIYDIGQFFVLRKFKGKGVGRDAFRQSVSLYPGKWLTRVLNKNESALKFWLKVIGELSNGNYRHETEVDGDLPMHFIRYEVAGS